MADTGSPHTTDHDDELLDRLDAAGHVIGVVRRGDCHGNPALRHRAVHVFVRNRLGDVFLQRRSASKRIQPGRWDTAVGGHVPAGESWEQAARRELAEELGISNLNPDRLVHAHDYVWASPVETEHVRTWILEHEGPFRLDPEEIDEGRFWACDELRQAIGSGILTPNLEDELRRFGIVDLEPAARS